MDVVSISKGCLSRRATSRPMGIPLDVHAVTTPKDMAGARARCLTVKFAGTGSWPRSTRPWTDGDEFSNTISENSDSQNVLKNNSRAMTRPRKKMLLSHDLVDSILKATVVMMMMILVG